MHALKPALCPALHCIRATPQRAAQARSVGDETLTEGLRGSVKVMALQLGVVRALQGRLGAAPPGPGRDALSGQLTELNAAALDISDLYNAYAQPRELWDVCLEICDFAGNVPAEYVAQLWDLLLKQAWEGGGGGGGGGLEADVRLERCCEVVEGLGAKFYPNEGR